MLKISRFLGIAAAIGVISLWSVLGLFAPYGTYGLLGGSYLVIWLMIILAVIGLGGVLMDNPYVPLVVFALSFVPVGLYLLGTPGLFKWIGLFDLLFLVSGLLMFKVDRPHYTT